jgi:hypothetical protein
MIVRSPEVLKLIEAARAGGRLELTPVDADFIAQTQAAGLRHRRDGLAYRLTWHKPGVGPRKRVGPSGDLPLRRKLVYRLRYAIARGSHRMLRLARRLSAPAIYTRWARTSLRTYQSVAWSRGRLGKLCDRLLGPAKA